MSRKFKMLHAIQHSVEDSSWTTLSDTDDIGHLKANMSCVEESLDATLPLDFLEELDECQGKMDYLDTQYSLQSFPKISSRPIQSPFPPTNMEEFRPAYCSSALQLCEGGSTLSHEHKMVSRCKERMSDLNRHTSNVRRQTTPRISEISKPNQRQEGLTCALQQAGSEEFKPQRCSTALDESDLKIQRYISALPDKSNMFVPLRCSSEISQSAVNCSVSVPMTKADFKPHRCSTGLDEGSLAFIPLRSSTGLNDSVAFNPPLSSTAQNIVDDSCRVTEFQKLKLSS